MEKARLMEIDADENARVVPGTEIPVQFNPASLKLALANKVETQETRGQQTRQYLGKTSTTLSFDLEFDTSDEGATDAPVSVRTRTSAIERFVLPKGSGKQKQKPPKARFIWQDLQIDGVIEDLAIDFTLFASDGTPLRAKMAVTMKEQDAKYQLGKLGPGANAGAASAPGGGSVGPGSFGASFGLSASAGIGVSLGGGASLGFGAGVSVGASLTDSTRMALSGESAAEFAARNGLDPAAWRGVTGGQASSLSFSGGAEVDFHSSLSAGGGVGVTVGVDAGTNASLEAQVGLDVRGAVATPAGIALGGVGASAGFALSAAGGVSAALATVSGTKAGAAAATSKASFGAATAAVAAPSGSSPSREPLARTGMPSVTMQAAAPSAPPSPKADPRATSFGFGVPLRPSISGAADMRRGSLGGSIPLRPHVGPADGLLPTSDPTAAPWTHLPADRVQRAADTAQRTRRPLRPCGCSGPCTHRGSGNAHQ
jgi:contractile injection system tube protein